MSTAPHIVPGTDQDTIITLDQTGYHIDKLGAEVVSVDPGTGEVCRKRPAVSRVDVPVIGVDAQSAILTDHLRELASYGDNSAEMALVLQQRANAHIAAYMARARKAAKV